MLDDLTRVPPHDADPSFYTDWADAREYTLGDMGVGECAGEVVSPIEFALTACEREVFEAQLHLDGGEFEAAARTACESMLGTQRPRCSTGRCCHMKNSLAASWSSSANSFTTRRSSSIRSGGASSRSISLRLENVSARHDADTAHRLVDEAQLFLEACHSCYGRMMAQPVAV